jgi:hypothetical protein
MFLLLVAAGVAIAAATVPEAPEEQKVKVALAQAEKPVATPELDFYCLLDTKLTVQQQGVVGAELTEPGIWLMYYAAGDDTPPAQLAYKQREGEFCWTQLSSDQSPPTPDLGA